MQPGGEHGLEGFLHENCIKHIMGRVNHPQTQGKVERSHGSAMREMAAVWGREPQGLEEYGSAVGRWVWFYNTVRPHESLGYRTPAEVFREGLLALDDPEWVETVRDEFPDGRRAC